MDRTPSHYEVLGVAEEADAREIRAAYVRLARQLHPDAHAGRSGAERAHAERRMSSVNAAWSVLSNPDRRRAYDAAAARTAPRPSRPPPPAAAPWRPRADDDGWMDGFGAWEAETDLLPPDPPGPRRPVRLLPAAILGLAGFVAVLGLVLGSDPTIALAASLALISLSLFVWLPLAELARGRRADLDP